MLKRLIGTIIVHGGQAVQSIGYARYLPLGRPEVIAENYDRWQLDEILVIDIDATRAGAGPNLELMRRIAAKKLMTPLCYMGGVRNPNDALALVAAGADRVAMESTFLDDPDSATAVAQAVGKQAVIRVQPLHAGDNGTVHTHDYRGGRASGPVAAVDLSGRDDFSELLIIDWKNEGRRAAFDMRLIEPFREAGYQIICFGGISTRAQVTSLFAIDCVSAVAIGNALSWTELPHRALLSADEVSAARAISYGAVTRGAREW